MSSSTNLEQQRKRAKELLRADRAGAADAAARVKRHLPGAGGALTLSQAQLVVAREAGFASWPRMVHYVEQARLDGDERRDALLSAALAGDSGRVRAALAADPDAARRSIHVAAALGDADAALALLAQDGRRAALPSTGRGWKPLVFATCSRHGRGDPATGAARVRIAERLLDLGADANEPVADRHVEGGWRWPLAGAARDAANPELVDLLVRRGAAVETPPRVQASHPAALIAAVAGGEGRCVTRVLAARPALWEAREALEIAVEADAADLAGLLLAYGAWPDHAGRAWGHHGGCLHGALMLGRGLPMLDVLLAGGATVEARDRDGRTPLAIAVRTGATTAAELLRRHGARDADVSDVDRALGACVLGDAARGPHRLGRSDHQMLCWAVRRGHVEAVPALLALGLDPNIADDDGETPLHLAVAACHPGVLEALLAARPRLDVRDFANQTPLMKAMREPDPAVRQALVDRLSAAGAPSGDEDTDLEELFEEAADAVVDGDLARLRELLDDEPRLATARSSRPHRATLLHYVGANGVEQDRQRSPGNAAAVAELLLERGAVADAPAHTYGGGPDQTALALTVTSVHPERAGVMAEIVRALVRGGAQVNGVDDDGALLRGALRSALPALIAAGARLDLRSAARVGRLDLVERYLRADGTLEAGAKLRRESALPDQAVKNQALIDACAAGHAEIARALLGAGARIDAKDAQGMTPLHMAAWRADLRTVRLLIDAGAPLEAENLYGGTVLDFVVWVVKNQRRDGHDYPTLVELLIAAGADLAVVGASRTGFAPVDEVLERHRAPSR